MKSEFDNLRENNNHCYDTNENGDKKVVRIYDAELLIAKRITLKKSVRYFGINNYQKYLIPIEVMNRSFIISFGITPDTEI